MDDIGQDDIDKLLNNAMNAGNDSGTANQDDIDALLAAAAGDTTAPAASAAPAPAASAADSGTASQDDIDALLAAASAPAPAKSAATADNSTASQDDIDALLAAASAPAPAESASSADSGTASQDDIDALLAAASAPVKSAAPALAVSSAVVVDDATVGQDDIDALLAAASADAASPPVNDAPAGQDDIDALLAAASADAASPPVDDTPAGQDDIDAMFAAADAPAKPAAPAETSLDEIDGLLKKSGAEFAATTATVTPPAPAPTPTPPAPPAPAPASQPALRVAPSELPRPPELTADQIASLQNSLALSGSSGEVESIAGQISELLGQLSERSRRYQSAWLAADQQARELRYLHSVGEQKVATLAAEKEGALQEADAMRKQFSRSEGEKIAANEAQRTEIAALQSRMREQESRNQMLLSEIATLKDEIERVHNSATGADLESRRARFDVERMTGELNSERQERSRLTRALENREKELQAMQAQAAGHASTLFLDELHRLVRRLESELDLRNRAANEALAVFDRMEFTPEMQIYAATLRSSLCAASGLSPDENDALKALDGAGERRAIAPLEPAVAPGEDTFIKALTRYDFAKASAIASALMRAGNQSPYACMKEIYRSDALKHPEISAYLNELASLLRGIKSLQEASDRSRGREGEQTEKMLVMMFDLLHTLVRLKLVGRGTPAIWEFFLELRGRFSFLTSDRQWQEYRDKILTRKVSAAA
ncbi:MAG: hypothetical protein LBP75_09325 [Planctomycetota bacterium]|jgi:hypothetical protein|nr:hypothetical protein [Planctomycetota bacterium]